MTISICVCATHCGGYLNKFKYIHGVIKGAKEEDVLFDRVSKTILLKKNGYWFMLPPSSRQRTPSQYQILAKTLITGDLPGFVV